MRARRSQRNLVCWSVVVVVVVVVVDGFEWMLQL